jgi:hypothetical protein
MTLREEAAATRKTSAVWSTLGVAATGIVVALPALFASDEFSSLMLQWFANNPELGLFLLFALNTLVTEILKALRNANLIRTIDTIDPATPDHDMADSEVVSKSVSRSAEVRTKSNGRRPIVIV